ncbi:MAG: lipopolysaccharide heptosyltransferase II [Pyrinomonadaceae bacterium]|nr:lipopolysaccharide heptosyltransferase II [Pyrinomonadaceae bacterium]
MKILVRGTNWIGDAVMSVPALRELRRIFPDSHITLHTRSWADGLFRDADFIDELVTFDKHRWAIKDVYDNSQFLKGDGFELAILLPNSFETAITSFLSRIPRRIGYNKDIRGLLLTDPIAVPEWKNRHHEVFYYLNLVGEVERRVLGRETVVNALPNTAINVSDERKDAARSILMEAGVDLSKKIVALGVGSTNSRAKRWPAGRYAQLADKLATELDVNVILVGSPDEADISAEVADLSSKPLINMTGKTDLGEAVAVLSVVDLLISNDMGLAHIAPAVGTDAITIFGPTNPETTRPFAQNAEIIRKAVECSPCMLRDCPIDHRCMTQISVEEVFDAAKNKLFPSDIDDVYDDIEDEVLPVIG